MGIKWSSQFIDKSGYITMPRELIASAKLSTKETVILAEIFHRINYSIDEGTVDSKGRVYCLFTQEQMKRITNINSPTTITGITDSLEAKGLIRKVVGTEIQTGRFPPNMYYLHPSLYEIEKEVEKEDIEAISEAFQWD